MAQPDNPNAVYVLADLSKIPRTGRNSVYGVLLAGYTSITGAQSRGEIAGLKSITRVISEGGLEALADAPKELIAQIKEYNNADSIGLFTCWEQPGNITDFYQSPLHQGLSEGGMNLTAKGAKLIVFQYICGKLSDPVIIE